MYYSERRRRRRAVVETYGQQAGEGEESGVGEKGRALTKETRERKTPGATPEVVARLVAHGQVFDELPIPQATVDQKHVSNNRIMCERGRSNLGETREGEKTIL